MRRKTFVSVSLFLQWRIFNYDGDPYLRIIEITLFLEEDNDVESSKSFESSKINKQEHSVSKLIL